MQYLPQRKRDLNIQSSHKQEKVKDFRRYLADNNVVLAFVKYLLSLRDCKPWPQNPTDYLKDFFGSYRDPLWDDLDKMKEQNSKIQNQAIPQLEETVKSLEEQIRQQRKRNNISKIYKQFDTDGTNQIGYKLLINKLSGQPKFDLDTKLTNQQFIALVLEIAAPQQGQMEGEENNKVEGGEDDHDEEVYFKAFADAAGGQTPFAGDLQNPIFKRIVAKIRGFVPPVEEAPQGD